MRRLTARSRDASPVKARPTIVMPTQVGSHDFVAVSKESRGWCARLRHVRPAAGRRPRGPVFAAAGREVVAAGLRRHDGTTTSVRA